MTTKKQIVLYSHIRYCPNPSTEDGMIDLGIAMEFRTSKYSAIALAVRADIDKSRLDGCDEITRSVLDRRGDVLIRELEQVLPKATNLGDALRAMSAANPWSITVTMPLRVELSLDAAERPSAEQLAEQFTLTIMLRELEERREIAANSLHQPKRGTKDIDVPAVPAWMCAPKTILRPVAPVRTAVPA